MSPAWASSTSTMPTRGCADAVDLHVNAEGDPPTGYVEAGNAPRQEFSGWLDLLSILAARIVPAPESSAADPPLPQDQ